MTCQAAYRDLLPASFLQSLDITQQTPGWKIEIAKTLQADACSHIMLADTGEHGLQGFVIFGLVRNGVIKPDNKPGKSGQIYSIYVMPDFLKHGIGQSMLNAAFNELRKEGYIEVYLTVLEANTAAHRFYEKQGGRNTDVETSAEIVGERVPRAFIY